MVFEDFDDGFSEESVADEGPLFDLEDGELTGPPRFSNSVDYGADPYPVPLRTLATVLVVDDNPIKLQLLVDRAHQILGNDIRVIATGDLSVVISTLRGGVSAVLTDYELGEFTGRDVAEFAIENGIPPNHILVATGNPEEARAVVPAGVEVFEVPHELDSLNAALRNLGRRLRGFIAEA